MEIRCWGSYVVEEDGPLFKKHVVDLAPGASSVCELRLRKKDGGLTWFQSYAQCEVSMEDLDHHRIYGALVDITERKQAEERLQKRELQLRESQAAAMIGNWGVDVPTNALDWSDETFRRFDKDPATFKTSVDYFVSRIHPEDLPATLSAMNAAMERDKPYHVQTRIINETGRQWVMEAFGVVERDREGKPLRFSGTAQDITKRKQADDELLLKRDLMEKVSEGLFIVDPDSRRFLDVNESACAQMRCTKEELLALHVEDLDPEMSIEQWPAHLEMVRDAEKGLTIETWHQRKDGSRFQVELCVRHVTLDDRSYLITSARDITERKRAEATLLHNQAMLARTEGLAHVGSWEWEVATDTVVWSKELFNILQWDPAEGPASYADHLKLYPPQDLALLRPAVEAAVLRGVPYELELHALRPSGEVRICLARGFPEQDSDGKVWRLFGTLHDITDQKQSERFLQESEERLRLALDATSDGLFDWDITSGKTYYSPAYIRMLGYELDEFTTQITSWSDLIVPEDRERTLAVNEACIQGPDDSFVVEFRMKARDGAIKWIRGRGKAITRNGEGRALRILGTHQDITEKKLAEERLRISEERFRQISSSMMDVAYSCNRQPGKGFTIDWMTGATEALFGRPIEEVKAAHCWGNFVVEEDVPLFMSHVLGLAVGESRTCELRLRKKDGGLTWIQSHAQCEAAEEVQGHHRLLGALVDITGSKLAAGENARLQAQLQQAQKMESLGTLSGGIAHDMNNVLGAILGLASANVEIQPPGSRTHRAFETIVKAATRGGEMVGSLLAFARQSQAVDRVLDVNAILREEAHLLERTTLSRVRLVVDLEPGLLPIHGDASALINAFMNLSVNAVDAMPEHGTLTLRTRNLDGNRVEVTVEDTGLGMPREVLDRAMEPFFTTKDVGKGTGLGLSMVYSTVRAHGGQIEIQSAPGEGTQVRMRFPACELEAETTEPKAEIRPETSMGGMKVLLVDDDELIQTSVETILQTLGHAVITSASGEKALATLEAGFKADVVILDMNMPGLGGAGTLPRLRAMLPQVPVLLSTGRTDQVALDLAGAYPLVTLLPKPFTIKDLQRCLATLGRG